MLVFVVTCPQMGSENILGVFDYEPSSEEINKFETDLGYGEDSIEVETFTLNWKEENV